jgi:selenocysteine-specific elongation factor
LLDGRVEPLIADRPWGVSETELIALTGRRELPVSPNAGEYILDPERITVLRRNLTEAVRQFHKEQSLQPGIHKQDLKGRVMPQAPAAVFEHILATAPELVQEGEVVRLKSHRVVLKMDEQQARADIESAFERAGLTAPDVQNVLKSSNVEPARARSILQMLLREKKLARISDELVLHASALAGLRAQLTARKGERFSVPAFKDWTGVSRKYAIPLLEYLDREHVTKRDGDERVIL